MKKTTAAVSFAALMLLGVLVAAGMVPASRAASTDGPMLQAAFTPTGISPSQYQAGGTGPFQFASPSFQRVWDRTDHPVKLSQVSRTWFWGPGPNTPALSEQYNEDPTGKHQRLVQYFDKSRMEINNPGGDPNSSFFVTNGLLTVELISGFVQVGEKDYQKYRPSCIPMTGDANDTFAPTYFSVQRVSNTQAGDHPAPDRTGQKATDTIDRAGNTGNDPSRALVPGVDMVHFEPQTKHNIPRIFWDFLNSSGPVHNEADVVVNQQLITPWFFASGLPISEAYWTKATVGGQIKDVMIQAFERRALTYVPSNSPGFQVEMSNIGQHYFDWRYRDRGVCPAATPAPATNTVLATSTVPAPTKTAVRTATPTTPSPTRTTGPTSTPCIACPTPRPTASGVPIPPGTVVDATITIPTPTTTVHPLAR
ncbi:MAG: hypothetical protein M3014_02250 [Chloroflexota bacterium]|nr:hypothetical protein [Chloroflexota bacterium]